MTVCLCVERKKREPAEKKRAHPEADELLLQRGQLQHRVPLAAPGYRRFFNDIRSVPAFFISESERISEFGMHEHTDFVEL